MAELFHFPSSSFDPEKVSWIGVYSGGSSQHFCGVDLAIGANCRTVVATFATEAEASEMARRVRVARQAAQETERANKEHASWVAACNAEIISQRRELDRTGHQIHRGAADALEKLLRACGPNASIQGTATDDHKPT